MIDFGPQAPAMTSPELRGERGHGEEARPYLAPQLETLRPTQGLLGLPSPVWAGRGPPQHTCFLVYALVCQARAWGCPAHLCPSPAGRTPDKDPEATRTFEEFVESKGLNRSDIARPPQVGNTGLLVPSLPVWRPQPLWGLCVLAYTDHSHPTPPCPGISLGTDACELTQVF